MVERRRSALAWTGRGVAALLACLGAVACSSASDAPAQSKAGLTGDAGAAGSSGDAAASGSTGCDKPSQTYVDGMSQKGTSGALTFVIDSISTKEPTSGVISTWEITLLDASGQPVTGATFPTVKAWMPEHTHGWTGATVTEMGGGKYEVDNMYLFMPGLWQLTFDAQAGTTTDSTMFTFCIGG